MTLTLPAGRWITGQHWRQFRAEGYMVIRDVVPASLTGTAVRDIAAFVGADFADSRTWYSGEQQLEMVHHSGCDKVQGFLLGRPAPASSALSSPRSVCMSVLT